MSDADHAPTSDAAAAFDGLRQEVKLLRMAVGAWVDQQPTPPDYSETLGRMAEDLTRTSRKVAWVAQRPALALSPNEMAHAIKVAGEDARTVDRKLITEAASGLRQAASELAGWTVQARTAERQERRLLQVGSIAGGVGLALGLLLPLAVSGHAHAGRPHREVVSFALSPTKPGLGLALGTKKSPQSQRGGQMSPRWPPGFRS